MTYQLTPEPPSFDDLVDLFVTAFELHGSTSTLQAVGIARRKYEARVMQRGQARRDAR